MKILIGKYYVQKGVRQINGILLGTDDSKIQMTEIDGLEFPPIRNNSGDWSGKDGGYMSAQLFSGREITIQGFYYDNEYACEGHEESIRETMINFLKIRKKFPIFIETNSGRIFYTEGFITEINCPYSHYQYGDYSITFYCPSAELKEAEQFGDVDSVTKRTVLYKDLNDGGHLVPEDLPVLFKEGHHAAMIEYTGSMNAYPRIVLTGPMTSDITVLNNTLKKYVTIKYTLQDNAEMIIDMNSRQVTVNGSSISLYIDENSEWWYLQPGNNQIYLFSGDDEHDNRTATIEWTNNYQGI